MNGELQDFLVRIGSHDDPMVVVTTLGRKSKRANERAARLDSNRIAAVGIVQRLLQTSAF